MNQCLKVVILFGILTGIRGQNESEVLTNCQTYEGMEGVCIQVGNCTSYFIQWLQSNIDHGMENLVPRFSELTCPGTSLICCPKSHIPATKANTAEMTEPQEKPRMFSENCGVAMLVDRITNGDDAQLGAWPWMVILRGRQGHKRAWFCGGTLITNRHVLTAAHCFSKKINMELDFARIGEYNLAEDPDCNERVSCAPHPQDIPVERVIVHPSYNSPCEECNDIAILQLSRPAQMNSLSVNTICLPLNFTDFNVGELSHGWAIGWGSVVPGEQFDRTPDILQEVFLKIEDSPFCQFLKRKYTDSSTVLCAGGKGKDTCRGDSGGPLSVSDANSIQYLIGITSLGPRSCGDSNTVGVYTDVRQYVPWILENISN